MRKSHICPKCNGREIVYVPRIVDRSGSDTFPLALWVGVRRKTGHGRDQLEYEAPFGQLEAFVCQACGYAELYVADVSRLKLEDLPGATVIRGPGSGAPYR